MENPRSDYSNDPLMYCRHCGIKIPASMLRSGRCPECKNEVTLTWDSVQGTPYAIPYPKESAVTTEKIIGLIIILGFVAFVFGIPLINPFSLLSGGLTIVTLLLFFLPSLLIIGIWYASLRPRKRHNVGYYD